MVCSRCVALSSVVQITLRITGHEMTNMDKLENVDECSGGCVCYHAHPLRIQRRRTKGHKMPKGAVYVGRPSKWGNPFETAIEYRDYVLSNGYEEQIREELQGKLLACWCPLNKPCHADVLAEIANRSR